MPEIRIDNDLIEHMSWLSRVKLTDEEKNKLKKEIELLIEYINDVLEINVESETEYLYPSTIHYRDDVPDGDEEKGRQLLSGAVIDKGFVRAPKVVKKE